MDMYMHSLARDKDLKNVLWKTKRECFYMLLLVQMPKLLEPPPVFPDMKVRKFAQACNMHVARA